MELFADNNSRPQVMVRINPDAYTDVHGVYHASCFYYDDKKALIVDDEAFEERYIVFKGRLEHWQRTIPEKETTVEHLFYNGYDISSHF